MLDDCLAIGSPLSYAYNTTINAKCKDRIREGQILQKEAVESMLTIDTTAPPSILTISFFYVHTVPFLPILLQISVTMLAVGNDFHHLLYGEIRSCHHPVQSLSLLAGSPLSSFDTHKSCIPHACVSVSSFAANFTILI